jgi:hypothetical protein
MATETDSPERIAADILISMMNSGVTESHKKLAKPEEAVEAFKKLFKAVHNARTDSMGD